MENTNDINNIRLFSQNISDVTALLLAADFDGRETYKYVLENQN